MNAPKEQLDEKTDITVKIKQENVDFLEEPAANNFPLEEPATNNFPLKDELNLVGLDHIKNEPEYSDTEHECSYFVTQRDLDIVTNTDVKPEQSDTACSIVNISPSRRGRKRKHSDGEKACEYCGQMFKDAYKLKKHIMNHTGERPFKCDQCESTFKEKHNLIMHVKTHTGDRQIPCPECDKTFIVRSALKAHMRTHTKEKPYVCNICGKAFSHSTNLKPHMATHSEDFPFHCLECGKSFRMRKGLLRHIRGHHMNCTKEGCEFCAQFDKTKIKPRKYVKVQEKIRECHICLQTFRYYTTYKNHMRAHNNENFTCSFCGKSYVDRASMRIHLRNHTGETPYVCTICGKKFKRGDSYRYHVSTHNEERKLYTCDICNQGYTHRSSLLKHIRHVHEDERPFQCDFCERRFKTIQVLRGHLKTHGDGTVKLPDPETCRICGKIVDIRGYKIHMKSHGIDTFKCKKCRSFIEGEDAFETHKKLGCKRYKHEEHEEPTLAEILSEALPNLDENREAVQEEKETERTEVDAAICS